MIWAPMGSPALVRPIGAAVAGYDALIARDDVDLIYCALPPAGHLATKPAPASQHRPPPVNGES